MSNLFIIKLIRTLRPDLCKIFPIKTRKEKEEWLFWLISSGINEYKSLSENDEIKKLLNSKSSKSSLTLLQKIIYNNRPDVQKEFNLKKDKENFLQWFCTHGIQEHNLYRWLDNTDREIIQYFTYSDSQIDLKNKNKKTNNLNKFGVNIIGYVYGQLGIGEDARMAGRSMISAKIPFTMIDFPPGADISQNDRTMEKYVSKKLKYHVNLFCLTALEHGRYYAENGKSHMEGRYNIGYWPWELSKWPKEWNNLDQLVDEIWVSTKHTYDAVKQHAKVPVYIMPMAVELGSVSNKKRQDFGLPKKTKLFCFSFDLNSSIHRKNPQSSLESFFKAFPKNSKENVGLVIKVHPPKRKNKNWERLKKLAAKDKRIYIIEKTLSRKNLLALYQNCDCFLSLHRAEGFGRGIAEAIQLGIHVIATGYSGNIDFCKDNKNVDLVDYSLVKVKKNQYPFGKDQVWADVDVNHASQLMKNFIKKEDNKKRNTIDIKQFSTKVVGKNYKKRLMEIL